MIEIRNDDNGELDELVGKDCDVHLERTDTGAWCLVIEGGMNTVHVNLWTPRNGVIRTTVHDDKAPTHAE